MSTVSEPAGTQDIAMEQDSRLPDADPVLAAEQRTAASCGAQNYGVRVRPTTIGVKFTNKISVTDTDHSQKKVEGGCPWRIRIHAGAGV